MPTKTNKPSPLKAIPPQLIVPLVKGGIGGVTGGFSAGIDEFKQVRDELKEQDFKEQKFGKKLGMLGKAGLRAFGAYGQGMLGGISKGLLGTDFGLSQKGLLADNQPGAEEVEEQPTYRTNIDPMTGEEILPNQDLVNKYGIPMAGKPIKALTQMQGTLAHNMSAKQYNKALQMKEISGAATMMTANEAEMVKALESDDIPENDVVAEKIKNK